MSLVRTRECSTVKVLGHQIEVQQIFGSGTPRKWTARIAIDGGPPKDVKVGDRFLVGATVVPVQYEEGSAEWIFRVPTEVETPAALETAST